MLTINGSFQNNNFVCDTGHTIEKYEEGVWAGIKQFFWRDSVWTEVQDKTTGKHYIYVPLSEVNRIAGRDLGKKKVGKVFAQILYTIQMGGTTRPIVPSTYTEFGESKGNIDLGIFKELRAIPGTDLFVRSRVDNYYSIWFQIEKKGKRVGQVQLEFLFFKGGEYSSQYRDHALPADSLYLFDNRSHGNYIRILEHEFLGETEEEREQVAKALLQTVMEFGNLNHVDGRVCMSVGGGEEVILYRQGVRCEREDLNSCIAKWSDDNDLKDHGGFTMFVTRECAEKFNKLITEHPIYQAHSG